MSHQLYKSNNPSASNTISRPVDSYDGGMELNISQPEHPLERQANRLVEGDRGSRQMSGLKTHGASKASRFDLGRGRPLSAEQKASYESRFDADFSNVRIFSDPKATAVAEAIQARAFTIGHQVVLPNAEGTQDESGHGDRLGHELAHIAAGHTVSHPNMIWREGPRVRSPVMEETIMQYTAAWGGWRGRYLSPDEVALAKTVFGKSLDYSRIRFIPSEGKGVDWRVVGNTIREPKGFTIKDDFMAKTFIHELTHVWQYQHGGTAYISGSLFGNLAGIIAKGYRNAAYEYTVKSGKSFFEYAVEQQAAIVEDYFLAVRKLANPEATTKEKKRAKSTRDKLQPLIDQMRASAPRRELDVLNLRASELIGVDPKRSIPEVPKALRILPVKPIFKVEW
jgi:hypothetical protein